MLYLGFYPGQQGICWHLLWHCARGVQAFPLSWCQRGCHSRLTLHQICSWNGAGRISGGLQLSMTRLPRAPLPCWDQLNLHLFKLVLCPLYGILLCGACSGSHAPSHSGSVCTVALCANFVRAWWVCVQSMCTHLKWPQPCKRCAHIWFIRLANKCTLPDICVGLDCASCALIFMLKSILPCSWSSGLSVHTCDAVNLPCTPAFVGVHHPSLILQELLQKSRNVIWYRSSHIFNATPQMLNSD